MKSKTVVINTIGDMPHQWTGPNSLCGPERHGGVSLRTGNSGGCVYSREAIVNELLPFLNQCVAHWVEQSREADTPEEKRVKKGTR